MKFPVLKQLISILCIVLIPAFGNAQMSRSIMDLPYMECALYDSLQAVDGLLKIKELQEFEFKTELRFEDVASSQFEDSIIFYPIESGSIHILDLDYDGDKDVLYSGRNGNMTLRGTKVFLNLENSMYLDTVIQGSVVHVQRIERGVEFTTYWEPCCDSYTNRIEDYTVLRGEGCAFKESTSFVGRAQVNAKPDFSPIRVLEAQNLYLYARNEDFRGRSPYFRDRNKEVKEILKLNQWVQMIYLEGPNTIEVLDVKEINGDVWYAVRTGLVRDAPHSLYEWSDGKNRRFVGWVRESSFVK